MLNLCNEINRDVYGIIILMGFDNKTDFFLSHDTTINDNIMQLINVTGFMETVPNRTLEVTSRIIDFKDFNTL